MPRLRHALDWNTSTRAVDFVEHEKQHDNADENGVEEQDVDGFELLRDILSELVIRRACASSASGKDGRRCQRKGRSVIPGGGPQSSITNLDSEVEDLQEFVEVHTVDF